MKKNSRNYIHSFISNINKNHVIYILSFCKKLILKYNWLCGLIILLVYFIPYLILGENAFFKVHDNLDGEVVYRTLLANEGKLLNGDSTIDQIMHGLPRFCLPSSFNVTIWFFIIFSPLKAYLINDFIARFIGFFGLYLLLTRHILKNEESNKILSFFIAFCFAAIPFYNIYGISVSGQPLLLFAFLNLLKRETQWWNYALILFFAFYSSFALSGIFICIALGLIFILDAIFKKKINHYFFFGLLILVSGYLICEHQLFISFLFNDEFVSHRNEFVFTQLSFKSALTRTKNLFFETSYHTGSLKTGIIIFSTILSFLVIRKKDKKLIILSLSIFFVLLIYLVLSYVKSRIGDDFILLKIFQWDRAYFLLPTLWVLLFAVALSILQSKKYFKYLVPFIIFFFFRSIVGQDDDYQTNLLSLKGQVVDWAPSFKQFYDEGIFNDIDNYINKNKEDYRVVSIGIHPGIAQFNGFFTLDSYQNNYPLEYKHQFRKIIEKELNKNEKIKNYFDNWGSRCYLFTAEYGTEFIVGNDKRATKNMEINNLEINTNTLQEMGCQYIFSGQKINNYQSTKLKFEKMFTDDNAHWKIYLYKLES